MKKLLLLLLTASLPALLAAQNGNTNSKDPFVGTWKLDVAKSHFTPGPAPTSTTVTITPNQVHVHEVSNSQNGEATRDWSYMTANDGQAAQIDGMPNSTVTAKRVNHRTTEHTWNFNGQIMHGRAVVSKDGKTMRYTMTGKTSNGQRVHDVEVFTKESS